jgi:hypothetical protein
LTGNAENSGSTARPKTGITVSSHRRKCEAMQAKYYEIMVDKE